MIEEHPPRDAKFRNERREQSLEMDKSRANSTNALFLLRYRIQPRGLFHAPIFTCKRFLQIRLEWSTDWSSLHADDFGAQRLSDKNGIGNSSEKYHPIFLSKNPLVIKITPTIPVKRMYEAVSKAKQVVNS